MYVQADESHTTSAPVESGEPAGRLPLRVLLVGGTHSPHTARLAAALAGRGHRVSVFNGPRLVDRVREQYGQALQSVSYEEARLRGNARLASVGRMEARWNEYRLRRRIARERIDVIHLNNLYCGERLDRFAMLDSLPAPMVVTAWGSDVDDSAMPKHPSYIPLRETLLHQAEIITAWSEPMVQRCRRFVPDRPERDFRFIPWYTDRTRFNVETAETGRTLWRHRLNIPADALVVLSPRGTAPNYQIDRIIRAFGRIVGEPVSQTPDRPQWVLLVVCSAGHDSARQAYLARLRDLAAPLGASVRFVQEVPHNEVAELFGTADVAVSIPKADGGPASYYELLALGVPLIVADLDDYRGVIWPYQNAVAVDATADEPLARALKAILTDAGLREQLRAGASASASDHGSFDHTVDAYVDVYREAIARAKQRRNDPLGICRMTYAGIGGAPVHT